MIRGFDRFQTVSQFREFIKRAAYFDDVIPYLRVKERVKKVFSYRYVVDDKVNLMRWKAKQYLLVGLDALSLLDK